MTGTRAKATALQAGLQLILAATLALLPARVGAQSAGVDTLFPAQPTGYVNDVAGLLDPGSAGELEALLRRLQGATGAEVAVVTLPKIGEQDEADVARAIGRRWRIGAKAEVGDPRRNAGAVVLVVPRQNHQPGTGHVRIETGQGLEGIVTDAAAGQIRREVMGPDLAREAYGPAIVNGVRALTTLIARGYGVSDSALTAYEIPAGGGENPRIGNLLPILLFILFMLIVSGGRGGSRRRRRGIYWGGPWIGGGWGSGGGFGGGGGGFGGFGGGGGFSGGGAGGRF